MRDYENYDRIAENYDQTRAAAGIEIILECLTRSSCPLAESVVVDAGCGSGNYSAALLDHVGRLEAVDLSEGMLQKAREKLSVARETDRVRFHQAAIGSLPLGDASADGVLVSQVMHHLDDSEKEGYPRHREAFAEFARVLKPGGILVVNTCSQAQVRAGYWYYALLPDRAVDALCDRYPPISEQQALMESVGFEIQGSFVPMDAILQGDAYLDPSGPLRREWRDGDSSWALLAEEELEAVLADVRERVREGDMERFVAEHDAQRGEIGQVTFLSGRRC